MQAGIDSLARKPNYVILDLMLPDGDGIEILRRVKALGNDTPVVVTTALVDTARLRAVQDLHPHRILRKPLDLVDLLGAIGMM